MTLRRALKPLALAALLTLTACGGGGGGESGGVPITFPGAATTQGVAKDTAPASEAPPAAPCSVAYWGDSISSQTGPRIDKRLQLTPHAVVGGTATAARAPFLQDPLTERFIVIQYGINDANFKIALEPALRSMLERVKAIGRTPVLTGISQATAGEFGLYMTHNAVVRKLATEYGAIYADWPGVPFSGAADLMPDGIHPLDGYAQRLADRLSQALLDAAPECAATSE